MTKSIKYFMFAALVVFMTACPFEAPFPIDEPGVKYSSSMLGKWAVVAEESEESEESSSHYIISTVDDYSFKIEDKTYDEEEESWSTTDYTAHLSQVGDYKFINLYDPSMETWYFYRMDWDDSDQFSMYAVTDYIDEEFDSSAEMKIFFEKHCELSFFYQSAESYVRVE